MICIEITNKFAACLILSVEKFVRMLGFRGCDLTYSILFIDLHFVFVETGERS